VNYELESVWKEAIVAYFEILSSHLPGVIEGNHDNPHSRYPVSGPRFEAGISNI
jgi:hypothetical protein